MDEKEAVNKTMLVLAIVLTFVAVIGLYFNITALINTYLDYRKAMAVSAIFNLGLLITGLFIMDRLRKN
ncbi:MAG: hypothetical protein GXO67_04765 [Archaeoglobi archaeon]|uniref:hypothetical protein n=1 Tax=Geoglobus ahangari TaxID=113653 RepID=UPI00064FA216|nr:hypothetical protein [Geoglobus ahangari]NOY11389.1 hypothetical protein [Archaeoglobi archaeon]